MWARLFVVLGPLSLFTLSAEAGSKRAEPVRQVTYQHSCECAWQGYCDADKNVFKVVRYDKKPDYQTGCAATSADEKWLRIHANKTCKASGFDRFFEVQAAGCYWNAEPETTWVIPKRQRRWSWVYRKRLAAQRQK